MIDLHLMKQIKIIFVMKDLQHIQIPIHLFIQKFKLLKKVLFNVKISIKLFIIKGLSTVDVPFFFTFRATDEIPNGGIVEITFPSNY